MKGRKRYNPQTIINEINAKGLTNTKANKFTKQSIAVILKNKFYIRIILHSDIEIERNHEEIVNKITFKKFNQYLKGEEIEILGYQY